MKKKLFFLCLLLVFSLSSMPVLAVVEQSSEFYVADYAGVLNASTKESIINANEILQDATGGQIVVVTVEYLDGMYSDEYAVLLFNDWGVGDADLNNGMLLLLATQENKAWLTQGSGIANSFTDNMISSLLERYFWDDSDNANYDRAVSNLFTQLVKWYENHYNVNISNPAGPSDSGNPAAPENRNSATDYRQPKESNHNSFDRLIFFVFIMFLIILLIRDRRRYRRYYIHTGIPMPRYRMRHFFFGPHRHYHPPHHGHHRSPHVSSPRSRGGFGGGGSSFGSGAGRGGSSRPSGSGSSFGGGGRSSGSGAGRGGSSSFSGGSRSSGSSRSSGGSRSGGGKSSGGGGGRSSGGGSGRR